MSHVLRIRGKQGKKTLASGVIAWRNQVFILGPFGDGGLNLSLGQEFKYTLPTIEEVFGIRHSGYHSADENELLDHPWVSKCEIYRQRAAMGTPYKNSARYFEVIEQGREVSRFRIPSRSRGRASVAAAVTPNGMKVLTECRSDIVPHSRIHHTVMDQNHGLGSGTAFFIIDFGFFHLDESARARPPRFRFLRLSE
jgi:hypothetical protein